MKYYELFRDIAKIRHKHNAYNIKISLSWEKESFKGLLQFIESLHFDITDVENEISFMGIENRCHE